MIAPAYYVLETVVQGGVTQTEPGMQRILEKREHRDLQRVLLSLQSVKTVECMCVSKPLETGRH